jgi:hypothetical protein
MGKELYNLKEQAKEALSRPKQHPDAVQGTDVFCIIPKDELEAIIASLYFTLEHSTTNDFPIGQRKSMLAAVRRMEE